MFIQRFIDRKEELAFLEREFRKNRPFFQVIYGRRRVGKTELIKKFTKDKEAIYFLATQEVEKENMGSLSEELAHFFNDPSLKISPFATFKQALEYLKEKANELGRKTLVVLDEFPYLVDANRAIPSIMQRYWDSFLKTSYLGFILCGSSIGAMESEVLGRKSPLYGRRSGQWKVDPLFFRDALEFFPFLDFKTAIEIYSIIGGIPLYLSEIDPRMSLTDNIRFNIARKGAFLYEEVPFILKEELREPKVYFSLLKEISSGKTKLNDIRNALGVERTLLGRYVETLETLDLVEKWTPVTAKSKSKNTVYFIKDNFFRFWFKFIFPHKKELERGEVKNLFIHLKQDLNQFIGLSFESVCREVLLKLVPVRLQKIGKQWGRIPKAPKGKNQYEIDICGINENTKEILFGECKWQKGVNAKKVISALKEKASFVDWHKHDRKEYYFIFAKTFRERIKEKDLFLVDLKVFQSHFHKIL